MGVYAGLAFFYSSSHGSRNCNNFVVGHIVND